MKTKTIIQLAHILNALAGSFLCFESCAQTLLGQETNVYPISEGSLKDLTDTGEEAFYYSARIARGEPISEIMPAEHDPSGNWGIATNNWQLSLRFRRSEYLKGEPVPAVVILRNLSSAGHDLKGRVEAGYCFGIRFTACRGTSDPLPVRKEEIERYAELKPSPEREPISPGPVLPVSGFLPLGLAGKTERLITVDVNRFHDLSQPGEYLVQARLPVFATTNESPKFEIVSGTVTFQIVEKPSPAGVQERKARDRRLEALRQ